MAAGYLERSSAFNACRAIPLDRAFIGPRAGRWVSVLPHQVDGLAYGGLIGTATGFGKFLQDQLRWSAEPGEPGSRSGAFEPQVLRTGQSVPMTLGWHIEETRGTRVFFKEGAGGGFRSLMRLSPSDGVATVIMANATTFNVGALARSIEPAVLPAIY